MTTSSWEVFNVDELKQKLGDAAASYFEFLNVPSMHCGVYRLSKGAKDMQSPHDEDEMYYVLEGRARLKVGQSEEKVGPGTLLYIRASEEHSFFEIDEDMLLLVVFSSGKSRRSN
jgi:mannose-6-phosphate isomerase-like protein (cupin superfamily)